MSDVIASVVLPLWVRDIIVLTQETSMCLV